MSAENVGLTGPAASASVQEAHKKLILNAQKLLSTIRGPYDSIFAHLENVSHTGAIRALSEMGVFRALPRDGTSMKASELAEKLKVDELLLVRLMRAATVIGPFKETGPQDYAHTPYSLVYTIPALEAGLSLMTDEYLTSKLHFAMFFKKNGWQNPTSPTNNPYTFTHRTNGKTMWEFMAQFPDRTEAFNAAMQAQTAGLGWIVGIFPFEAELSKVPTDDETVLVIDIGGGRGQATVEIRTLTKEIKGRVILQDLPDVVNEISEPLPGIELMKYNFFEPQPVKGALIYYIRRCLHDWPDADCIKILKNIAAAMDASTSRLVISEVIIPEQGVDLETVWSDLTMMTFAGCERTLQQWEALLDAAGLRLEKTYGAKATSYNAIEARLK
ncbi:o-methyltransferas-like protein [Cadophora sp. DSE1049]|nr:o-methyltransferas-like protein [Cadophora sp. DSE1049]